MKMQYEEILQTFENVKRKYPEVEKVWYELKTNRVLFKLDSKIYQWKFKIITEDQKLQYAWNRVLFNEDIDGCDIELCQRYLKLGLLLEEIIDEMLTGCACIELNDKDKSLKINGSVCFEEKRYDFLKSVFEERKKETEARLQVEEESYE